MQQWSDNEALLLEQLEQHRRARRSHGLLICSFRNYARIEALHGSQQAERLIATGHSRLQQLCPVDATLLRLQRAELALVVPGVESAAALEELAKRCAAECGVDQAEGQPPLLLSVAIGAALVEGGAATSSRELVSQALLARHQAEQRPGNQIWMADPDIQHRATAQYDQESRLATAIAQQQLIAYLQPIVQLVDGDAIGFECLARWPQPSGDMISPQDFLRQAHNVGMTADVDLQVLAYSLNAAEQLARAAGDRKPMLISVNISAQLIDNAHKIDRLMELIQAVQLPPTIQLQLELLEESLNDADPELSQLLATLADRGVLIAIDDFGTGYSSLSRLHNLKINTIKIDRSFVSRINAPEKPSNHLLQTLVAISHDLQIGLTAEGIEEEEQRQWLLQHGVQHGQGFLFSEPLSLEGALDYLGRQRLSDLN